MYIYIYIHIYVYEYIFTYIYIHIYLYMNMKRCIHMYISRCIPASINARHASLSPGSGFRVHGLGVWGLGFRVEV